MKINKHILDEVVAFGHPNVLGTHRTTLEITKENFLTKMGNCIIGVGASKSISELSVKLKEKIKNGEKIQIQISAGPFCESFYGFGNNNLELSNKISIVFRTSSFISDRTALINCSKSSVDINKKLIHYLKDPNHLIKIKFISK